MMKKTTISIEIFLLKELKNYFQQNLKLMKSNEIFSKIHQTNFFYFKQKNFPFNNFFSSSTTEATVPLEISKLELCQSYLTENSHSLCTFAIHQLASAANNNHMLV